MSRLLGGVSPLSIIVSVAALAAPIHAYATEIVVPPNSTSTETLVDGDTLTVQGGGSVSVNGTAVSSTVATPTGISVINSGTIESTAAGGRAINIGGSNNVRNIMLTNNQGGIIQSDSDTFRVNVDPATGSTITLNNNGLILSTTGGGQALDFGAVASGRATININNGATGIIRSNSDDAIHTGVGNVIITNDGLIDSTASANRGIDVNPDDLTKLSSFTLYNRAGATIQSQTDALRISGDHGLDTTAAQILIDNAGTIKSIGTGANNGQALDFDDLASTAAKVTIINRASGVITAADADAIRPGQNFTITNYGQIIANAVAVPTDRPGADGVDLQKDHSGTIYNYGLISGAKSGTGSDTGSSLTVYNYAGGTFIGQDGAGVSSGGTATVVNYGTITGKIDATSARGDGDGIDVDTTANITNYGLIQGLGAKGFDDGGRLNNSEGLAIGGGTIQNYGTISGAGAGIVVNNDSNPDGSRSGSAATSLANYAGGLIIGQTSYAVRFENKTGTSADNDSIVNYGTIVGNGAIPNPNAVMLRQDGTPDPGSVGTLDGVTYSGDGKARFIRGDGSAIQMGEGADVLTNYGTIIGQNGRAINMEGGSDTVNIMAGSKITGLVNGGAGNDTLDYNKVGLTEAKRAALQAGQIVNIGGTLYTSFETVTGAAQSFSSFATSGTTAGIANILDNGSTTVAAGSTLVALIDSVASANDVNAAMAQLTPGAFQAFGNLAINNALATTAEINDHLTDIRHGGLAVDVGGLATAANMFNAGLFSMKRGPFSEQVAAFAAEPASAFDGLMSGDPSQPFSQSLAYSGMPHGRSGNVYKAPAAAPELQNGLFVTSGVVTARQGAHDSMPASSFTTANIIAGIDRRLSANVVAGVFGGFARTTGDLDSEGSTTKVSTGFGGAYGSYVAGPWFANGTFLYGHSDYDNSRVALGTVNTSKTDGNQYAVQGAVGFDTRFGAWRVTPELGLQYGRVDIAAFTESGAAALSVAKDSLDSLRSSLGARFSTDWATAWGILTPELRMAWQHEYLNDARDIRASFVDAALPGTFATTTGAPGRDFALLGVGLSGRLASSTTVALDYDALIGADDFVSHRVMGRLQHRF